MNFTPSYNWTMDGLMANAGGWPALPCRHAWCIDGGYPACSLPPGGVCRSLPRLFATPAGLGHLWAVITDTAPYKNTILAAPLEWYEVRGYRAARLTLRMEWCRAVLMCMLLTRSRPRPHCSLRATPERPALEHLPQSTKVPRCA